MRNALASVAQEVGKDLFGFAVIAFGIAILARKKTEEKEGLESKTS